MCVKRRTPFFFSLPRSLPGGQASARAHSGEVSQRACQLSTTANFQKGSHPNEKFPSDVTTPRRRRRLHKHRIKEQGAYTDTTLRSTKHTTCCRVMLRSCDTKVAGTMPTHKEYENKRRTWKARQCEETASFRFGTLTIPSPTNLPSPSLFLVVDLRTNWFEATSSRHSQTPVGESPIASSESLLSALGVVAGLSSRGS